MNQQARNMIKWTMDSESRSQRRMIKWTRDAGTGVFA
jgi:hypothetical protein